MRRGIHLSTWGGEAGEDYRGDQVKLRTHQEALRSLVMGHIAHNTIQGQQIWAEVEPGGGKSLLPVLAYVPLRTAGIVDKVLWVVPRRPLARQAVESFLESQHALKHDYAIRQGENRANPTRGLNGTVVTYDLLRHDDKGIYPKELRKHRYLVCLDESHHCAEGEVSAQAVDPLVQSAVVTIQMSGTFQRHDRKPLAWVPYRRDDQGDLHTAFSEATHIRYTFEDALQDHAVVYPHFIFCDGAARWRDLNTGTDLSFDSLHQGGRRGLYIALHSGYARQLLLTAVAGWQEWQQREPNAQLLVVCATIDQAKRALGWLQTAGIMSSQIATTDETKMALAAIQEYRKGKLRALVTVGMAYEGLDVPGITHLACLTHIRSVPWLKQMFARAWRFNPRSALTYEHQECFYYVPEDLQMSQVVSGLKEQINDIRPRSSSHTQFQDQLLQADLFGQPTQPKPPDFIPLDGRVTGRRIATLPGVKRILGNGASAEQIEPLITPDDQEVQLREDIASLVKQQAYHNIGRYTAAYGSPREAALEMKRINGMLRQRFGKARAHMTLSELQQLKQHLRRLAE